MSDVDKSSKTEPPTEKRKSEAKNKGQFAKAPEISMTLTLLAGFLCIFFFAPAKAALVRDFTVGIFENLDSITLNESITQIPGLIFCGFLFGRIKLNSQLLVGHFRYGLICSFGSFLCGTFYFLQILFKNFSDNTYILFIPSIQNILAEVFLTGFFGPFFCSQLLRVFKFSRKDL